jgi:hypothetical protein
MPNSEPVGGGLNGITATATGLVGARFAAVVDAAPAERAGRTATGSWPPPVGAVLSEGGWATPAGVRTAAGPAVPPAGVVATDGADATGAALVLVDLLFVVAGDMTTPVGDGSGETLELRDSVGRPPPGSVGRPPPGDGPPGAGPTRVGPTGVVAGVVAGVDTTGGATTTEDVADVGAGEELVGDALVGEPLPWPGRRCLWFLRWWLLSRSSCCCAPLVGEHEVLVW